MRKCYCNLCATYWYIYIIDFYLTTHFLNDFATNRQTKPSSFSLVFCSEERIEDMGQD